MGKTAESPACVSFVPSRVEGIDGVTEVTVFRDRLELQTVRERLTFRFGDIGRRQEPGVVSALKRCFLVRPYPRMIADRNWFLAPPDRYFKFYTNPPITVYMPADDTWEYVGSCFLKIQQVVRSGGFETFDLG